MENYEQILRKTWAVLRGVKGVFEPRALHEFLELAFPDELMDLFFARGIKFDYYKELVAEMFEQGNQFWLILRSTFNHLFYIFARRPHLIGLGFEQLVANLAVSREIRSMDADIHLYRLETLLPEVVPKRYENLSLEEINRQGAYLRCMTLMLLESLCINELAKIDVDCPALHRTLDCLESVIACLLVKAAKAAAHAYSEMPYS